MTDRAHSQTAPDDLAWDCVKHRLCSRFDTICTYPQNCECRRVLAVEFDLIRQEARAEGEASRPSDAAIHSMVEDAWLEGYVKARDAAARIADQWPGFEPADPRDRVHNFRKALAAAIRKLGETEG